MLFDRTKAKAASESAIADLETQVRLHRDRMAGMWAAELLGLIGHAAQDYARELAHPHESGMQESGLHPESGIPEPAASDAEAGGDEDRVAGRLVRDLRGKVGPREIREKLAHLLHEARRQLLSDPRKR